MVKKKVIAYLHTHWDREWYREFEIFRLRLLRVFDNVLELLDGGKIPSFYFDGQTAALQDYLELRPEKEILVRRLIKEKKLFIGPFYCLVDEFMTSKRVFEKNLEFGLAYAKSLGCEDFIAYFADTFGHSKAVIPVLKEFGIDKCVVWRGCADIPSEFSWCGMDTVNLRRGYFMDYFSAPLNIEEKALRIKENLDKIAEKSGNTILLPIGGDHLGVESDISEQIKAINGYLDDYEIKLGSIFDYFKSVKFDGFKIDDELRDASNTFILTGVYSSRMKLKQWNFKCSKLLKLVENVADKKYQTIIDYAYKLLLQNLAHDGICGCSTDDVHKENIMRYKKIEQIANTILREMKYNPLDYKKGVVEIVTDKKLENAQLISTEMGFSDEILYDTQRVPITEDWGEIYTYLVQVGDIEDEIYVDDTTLKNSHINLKIKDENLFINGIKMDFIDFIDNGDSYNFGPDENDIGETARVISSMIEQKGDLRSSIECVISFNDEYLLLVTASLDKGASKIKFNIEWDNFRQNHLLQARFNLNNPVTQTTSLEMDMEIVRDFDTEYDIRKHLPKTRGCEVKTNIAPMQGFVSAQGINIETDGLSEYEVYKNCLMVTLLRATGVISNPKNPARSTPAGPPIPVVGLQQLGKNSAEIFVSFSDK